MRRLLKAVATLAAVFSPVLLVAAPPRAHACGNSVHRQNPMVAGVVRAERYLGVGKYQEAYAELLGRNPRLRHRLPGRDHLRQRANVLMARLLIATEGAVEYKAGGFTAHSANGRRRNLEWAQTRLLRIEATRGVDDPQLDTYIAQVDAQLPGGADRALVKLAGLEKRDVMLSAEGFVTLMKLRQKKIASAPPWLQPALRASFAPLLEVERARCELMASDDAICDIEALVAPKAPRS